MKRDSLLTYVVYAVLIVIFFAPILYMVDVSIMTKPDIRAGTLIPSRITLEHWREILTPGGYWLDGMINSIQITVGAVVVTLLATFPAGYYFSRNTFTADKHIFFWLLTNRMAPPIVFVIPLLLMYRSIGLFDSIPGVILAYCMFNVPIGIWLFTSLMQEIPEELDHAAFIDGHGLWGYFRRVFIPMNKNAIGVVAFFTWIFTWTEMIVADSITSTAAKTLPVQLLVALGRVGWGLMFGAAAAAGVITIIPGLILFMYIKDYMAKGFALGRV